MKRFRLRLSVDDCKVIDSKSNKFEDLEDSIEELRRKLR